LISAGRLTGLVDLRDARRCSFKRKEKTMHANYRRLTGNLKQTAYATAVTAGVVMTALPTQAQTSQSDNPDWPLRSSEIHWPAGHRPANADLFAHNELLIHAPCTKVWQHLVEAPSWPEWYPNSHNVRLLNSSDGELHQDTRFSWETFGVQIESRVHEFVPSSRLGWFGDGTGMNAYHTFLLLEVPEGCHVVTEEVVTGPGAVEFRKKDPSSMHRGHDLWIASLQKISEK
jgi:hypothetical protein